MTPSKNSKFYIDISPLTYGCYTGIPLVTLRIADFYLKNYPDTCFFIDDDIIPSPVVKCILDSRSPGPLFIYLAQEHSRISIFSAVDASAEFHTIGIFCNTLTRPVFSKNVLIIYDLTWVLESSSHTADTTSFYSKDFEQYSRSCDLFLPISVATCDDLVTYSSLQPSKISTVVLDTQGAGSFTIIREPVPLLKPFMLFLGTIEPRKNLELVFKAIKKCPYILDRLNLVVCGKDGWFVNFDDLLRKHNLWSYYDKGNIQRFSFISESEKWLLIQTASMLLYPSEFEGYGLPVAEALSVNTPVITTYSSSLMEAGGQSNLCKYILPDDHLGLVEAIQSLVDEFSLRGATDQRPSSVPKLSYEVRLHNQICAYFALETPING